MTPDKVIVSIEIQSGDFCDNYELPANVPLKDFQRPLLEALIQRFPQNMALRLCLAEGVVFFRKVGSPPEFIPEEDMPAYWRSLQRLAAPPEFIPEEDTLAAHGVRNGSCLLVHREWH